MKMNAAVNAACYAQEIVENKQFIAWLIREDACADAVKWVGNRTPQQAWKTCERGDWMLWLAGRWPGIKKTDIVLAACACARTALKHVPTGELRPLHAIESAEKWATNPTDANLRRVNAAANAAYSAANAAANAAYSAANAAYSTAYSAANAAYSAANAAYSTANAAYSTAYSAANAAANAVDAAHAANAAANTAAQSKLCDIIRTRIPKITG